MTDIRAKIIPGTIIFTEQELRILSRLQCGKSPAIIGDEVDLSTRTVAAIIHKFMSKTGSGLIEALIDFAVKNTILQ